MNTFNQINWKSPKVIGTIMAFVVLTLVALSIGLAPEPPPPATPTPIPATLTPAPTIAPTITPTLDPTKCQTSTNVHSVGGQVTLADADMLALLANQPWCLQITYESASTGDMVNRDDLSGVDVIYFGSAPQADEFIAAQKGKISIKAKEVPFVTYVVLWTTVDNAQKFNDAGYILPLDNGGYLMPVDKFETFLQAQHNRQSYTSLGIDISNQLTDEEVSVFMRPADFGSSSTTVWYAMMASCWTSILDRQAGKDVAPCSSTPTESDLNRLKPYLTQYYEDAGGQNQGSLGAFELFLSAGSGIPLHTNYNTALHAYVTRNGLTQEDLEKLSEKFVPIIIERTVVSKHTIVALTDEGKALVDALISAEAKRLAWIKMGMLSGALRIIEPSSIGWMNYDGFYIILEPSQPFYQNMNKMLRESQ